MTALLRWAGVLAWLIVAGGCSRSPDQPGQATAESRDIEKSRDSRTGQVVRCAVIGGLADTGLWQELSQRFEQQTGHRIEIVARGPKHEILSDFREGRADLIAMHTCDAVINLVADGYGIDPQPWLRNDFVVVGPADDPAGVRGLESAAEALQKIIESRSKFLIHASHGVQEVLHDVLASANLELDPEVTLVRVADKHRQMLLLAGQENCYTLIGRIPFLNGKVPNSSLEIMVQGDPALRRPYLVVTANRERFPKAPTAARELAAFLRTPQSQKFFGEFGRGTLDDRPIFFGVEPAVMR